MKKTVILGGTKGIGRAVARHLAERGDRVFLLGRNGDDLSRSAADLDARHPGGEKTGTALCDLDEPGGFEAALTAADEALHGFDTVIVTAALFATQEQLEADIELVQRLTTVNYAHTVVFCEHVRKKLLERGGGNLVVVSSVAGERGRKPVVIYGSGKAGVSAYLEGLDHKYRDQGLNVVCVKPGFVKTGATADLKPPPFAGEPESVAKDIVRGTDRALPVVYTPGIWRWVMTVIRLLPRFVMRRIGF